ncbi:hypothetical protein M2651_05995 [Clostridium sp. SYSU_GA19001]|uniref:hypothetical protein n=1 Tax=Clostridium caldaquaticum TaxID=2940653 RepID=UPI0020773251|nr:hypothetical protein [Clostridium caldaquaticum]MCM8710578.1 hypothetical protein [Clostridium caldaquaticum]
MSKRHKWKHNIGWIIVFIGIGIVITFIIPVWWWIIGVGAALIYVGWYLIEQSHH